MPRHREQHDGLADRWRASFRAARATMAGCLPERYPRDWRDPFYEAVTPLLRPGQAILDVGSGRFPAIPVARRPAGCRYVGFDASADELADAPGGSYDEVIVGDARRPRPDLERRFDLVVCWGVWEHLKPLPPAVEHMRSYVRAGGWLVARTSGAFAIFALANRIFPAGIGRLLMQRMLGRQPETVFPAHYDRCWYSALARMMRGWRQCAIRVDYTGAHYLAFSRALQALYILYEEWACRGDHRNLATYYIVTARA